MQSSTFLFIDKVVNKPELLVITDKLDDYFGKNGYISHFFTQESASGTPSVEGLLKSSYIEGITRQPTHTQIPNYRYLEGFEVEGCLANILFRGTCHQPLFDNHIQAASAAKNCISSIYQESVPSLIGYSFKKSWSSWFIDEKVMDTTLLVFCPSRRFWWLLCLTETD